MSEIAYCLVDHRHGPAVGGVPTGVTKDMPTLVEVTGDPADATADEMELLCEACLRERGYVVIDRQPVCPECTQDKHRNCLGDAWDDARDEPTVCGCYVANPQLHTLEQHP